MSFISQRGYLHGDPNTLLLDRKFDTAIRLSSIQRFIRMKSTPTEGDKLLWYHHPHAENYLQTTELIPRIIVEILRDTISKHSFNTFNQQRLWTILKDQCNLQLSYILDNTELDNTHHVPGFWQTKIINLSQKPEINRLLGAITELDAAIEHLIDINAYYATDLTKEDRLLRKTRSNHAVVKNLNLEMWWSYNMCVLKYGNDSYLLPRPYILQIKAKLADCLSVLVYAYLSSGGALEANAYNLVYQFVIEYSRLHVRRPNNFFTLAASIEGLTVGMILKRTEQWMNETLWNTLCKEVNSALRITLEHEPLTRIFEQSSLPLLAELGCLSKITGHPLVDMVEGARKLYNRVQEDFDVNIDAIAKCINHIKENYVCNFIAKFGRWPACQLTDLAHPLLVAAKSSNKSPKSEELVRRYGAIKLSDWSSILLEKEMEFDFCENKISLLADKAISVTRTRTLETYLQNQKPNLRETRLLLYYMFSDTSKTDHVAYLNKFMACEGDLDPLLDYLVIRLVPKEKELKVMFRGFGCKPGLDRGKTVVTGRNAMNFLQLCSDEQALTLSELQLTKKLHSFLRMKDLYQGHRIFYINFDASGWNNRFRDLTVGPVMEHTLDKIMGVKLWQWTHTAYENTLIVIPDEEHLIYWTGQKGGIEGLDQPTWQLVYSGQMKTAFEDTNFVYHLLGKGDDLRAAVPLSTNIATDQELSNIAHELITKICNTAKGFGHEIKLQESYVSEVLFTFSKSMYLHQVPLPYVFRKIQKTHGESNIFLPLLDDYVASAFSNSHGSCSSSSTHIPQYVVGIFWTLTFLLRHPVFNNCTDLELLTLLNVPSPVGGLPIIFLHNFFVRAESDLLTSFITLYKYCAKIRHPVAPLMENYLKIPVDQKASRSMLLTDPYSLPLFKPRSPSVKLRKLMIRKLKYSNVNREIKELISLLDNDSLAQLVKVLDTGDYWWAKLFSALYDSTPHALATKLIMQFSTAKSVLDLFLMTRTSRRRSNKLLSDIIQQDRSVNHWRLRVIRGDITMSDRREILSLDCPTQIAQLLRDTMWGKTVLTVTHPTITHQIILSTDQILSRLPTARSEHFSLYIEHPVFDPIGANNHHYIKGRFDPFLGKKTSPGTMAPTIKILESDPTCEAVLNLLMLHSYTNVAGLTTEGLCTSNFPLLIERLLQSFTSIGARELSPFSSTKRSGTQTHRLRSHGFNEAIIPNSNSILYSRCRGETNTHKLFRESSLDYTVNFLHILCYSIVVAHLDLQGQQTSNCPPEVWICTDPCSYCLKPIEEPLIYLDQKLIDNFLVPNLKLTRLGKSTEAILQRALTELRSLHPHIREYVHDYDNLQASQHAVAWFWILELWHSSSVLATRYRIHRPSATQLSIAEDMFGPRKMPTVGETEIRLLPSRVLIDVLSLFIFSYIVDQHYCFDPDRLATIFSTQHPEGFPWYSIVVNLRSMSCMSPMLSELHSLYQIPIPADALNNPDRCFLYISPLLYQRGYDLICQDLLLVIPIFTEMVPSYHHRLIKVLTPAARYRAALYLKQMLRDQVEEFFDLSLSYIALSAPEPSLTEVRDITSSDDDTPILLGKDRYNIQKDFAALGDDQHPQHLLATWACGEHYDAVLTSFSEVSMDEIEDSKDSFNTCPLKATLHYISITSAVDHLRSLRRTEGDAEIERAATADAVWDLMPTPKLLPTQCSKLPRYNKLPESAPLAFDTNVYNWLDSPSECYSFQTRGSGRPSVSSLMVLTSVLGLSDRAYNSIRNVLILNDADQMATLVIASLTPFATISHHRFLTDVRVVPRLQHRPELDAGYVYSNIKDTSIRHGLVDLSKLSTWDSLLEDLFESPDLIVWCHPDRLAEDHLIQGLRNLLRTINTLEFRNGLALIEVNTTYGRAYQSILSTCQAVFNQSFLVALPNEVHSNRMWIVGYGHYISCAPSLFVFCDTPAPQTTHHWSTLQQEHKKELQNVPKKFPQAWLRFEQISGRVSMLFPKFPHRLLATTTDFLFLGPAVLQHSDNGIALLWDLVMIMKDEINTRKKQLDKGEIHPLVPADRSLKHKLFVLNRLIVLEYLVNQLQRIQPLAGDIASAIERVISPTNYWITVRQTYSDWTGSQDFMLCKGQSQQNCHYNLTRAYQWVFMLLGYLYGVLRTHLSFP